jgi:anti-sigma regulatory factor (Ser/Thr protein kinase)
LEALSALHAALERFWMKVDTVLANQPGTRWRLQLATAMAEVGANIVLHAYKQGEAGGLMGLCLSLCDDGVAAIFTDRGVEFDTRHLDSSGLTSLQPPDVDVERDELSTSGLGLVLAQATVDEIRYHRARTGTNCWFLFKHLPQLS